MARTSASSGGEDGSDKWIGLLPAMLLALAVRIPQFLDRLLSGCNGTRACELEATGTQIALMVLLLVLCVLCGVAVSAAYVWRRRRRAGAPILRARIGLAWVLAVLVAGVALYLRYGPYAHLTSGVKLS